MTAVQLTTMAQAIFCGGLCFVIAFRFRRGESQYKFLPSLCAFGLASLCGQQWLSIIGRIMFYGDWPEVSTFNTGVYAILFFLAVRSKGNVARIFDLTSHR